MLHTTGIIKNFPGVQALRDVSIEVRPNEVVGLIGENGAGKSTLMRLLAGGYRPDGGTITLDGEQLKLRNARDAARNGIGMVFQEQSLVLNLTVAENIYLGEEDRFTRFGLVNWRAMNAAARRQLAKIGVDIDVTARTSELTFAARQMVELAKALTLEEMVERPLLILLDEPTSVLNAADIEVLFARVRSLKSRASFVFVSHRLDEVLAISDRVYTMKDGAVVAEHRAAEVTAPELHEIMVGRGLQAEYYREARQQPPGDKIMVEARGLGASGFYHGVDLSIRAGEIVGIAGVVGSGREEVTRTVGGFLPHDAGEMKIAGETVRFSSPEPAVRKGIGYVPRERRLEGLVMFLSIAENISLADLSSVMRNGAIDYGKERRLAADWIKRLSIKAPGPDAACRKLSGGNQQKVVLARWMTAGSRILVLDHPTRGLDVGAKEEVYELVRDLSDQGVAILLISDTLEETIGLSHQVLVMRDGEITARFDASPGNKPDQVELLRAMV
ncbi:sugar ABC transporter ATP-binding protein [Mesorhizobium sp. CA18]|uniref:sugar ABC transporter ATP-binding protein n=1 Tax=unclassified Mesorhizobium TaxID=325217 RepID=UPI001CCF67C9|nr:MULTISPECIES: sugar ABC transporter ATP-binding protein [unclassified Mesorhizobium]MBZ9733574.1 sugar ABC transporter ATP-binding protein [Mesorhizobium sp. CA9]MBZ9824239.1 sugar ABC transporter ATP-binding protein [Mesorhizobium sp. CA18]MBZ9831275.1 sugar ABC transporter ATP-binding protein [Mesorhizobium sp. CA2]MBZ9837439.1 sugar ABC transporter ATP-binding protein [Mesorhizobium sp. CA3]MBZ9877277.1 sugar ABC transporter ATP-binding protein [Mesorhizobium sp. Ca11]